MEDWTLLSEKEPERGDHCWVVDKKDRIYLAVWTLRWVFGTKKCFCNMIGKNWPVDNVIKWQPLIVPNI